MDGSIKIFQHEIYNSEFENKRVMYKFMLTFIKPMKNISVAT